MKTDAVGLDEVVVVGYGVQKRSDITGSVASYNMQDLEKRAATNVLDALKGQVAGLDITTGNNRPGAESSFLIRGMNSISASNEPLIILDGIPYNGDFNTINPNDIASVEVLKDASSAAIYGSRASNGVILVTSKKGSLGKPKINYLGRMGIQDQDDRTLELMDADGYINKTREFARFRLGDSDRWKELLPARFIENYEAGRIIDWSDAVIDKHAFQHEHNLSISGAGEKINYFTSLNYLDENGVYEGGSYSRLSFRTNLNYDITNWLSLGTNTMIGQIDHGGYEANFQAARRMSPFADFYNENGELEMYPMGSAIDGRGHPLAQVEYDTRDNITNSLFSNLTALVKVPYIEGLTYRFNYGLNLRSNKLGIYNTNKTPVGIRVGGQAQVSNREMFNYTMENIFDYSKIIGNHDFKFTGLYSREYFKEKSASTTATGFPNDLLTYHAIQTAEIINGTTDFEENMLISYMGRFNYNYNSKYLLTITMRRDGFSGFGADNKWGIFPSAALGWNIYNESFMQDFDFLSNLRLRLSYGETGNQAVGSYAALSRLGVKNYIYGDVSTSTVGFVPVQMANADLGWEATKSYNVGIDYGFLDNRLSGSIEYFNSNTEDLLLQRLVPRTNGVTTVLQNIGKTKNWGLEFSLNSVNIKNRDFTWTTNFNIYTNKNEIVDLYGHKKDDIGNRWFIGESIRVAYYRPQDGLWQEGDDMSIQPGAQPGFFKGVDRNGDGAISAADMYVHGSRDPDFVAGMTNSFTYKNFDLSILLHSRVGGMNTNDAYSYFITQYQDGNDANFVYYNYFDIDYWTPENTDAKAPAIYQPYQYYMVQLPENTTFLRLKEVSLKYTLPDQIIKTLPIERLSIFVTGKNLQTWTKFIGDPELNSNIDYPMTRTFVLGINLEF
jgi:TonB-linked SusC/RagA family outer membrane protein